MKRFLFLLLIAAVIAYVWIVQKEYVLKPSQLETKHYTKLRDMTNATTQGIIAVEDVRYRYHIGVDPLGMVRAVKVGVEKGKATEGASTITQQVARNAFLNQDRTVKRKVKEMMIALNLNANYSKDDVLEYYLNLIYYGHNYYGIYDAAKGYFGKEPKDLTIDETALLIGLPQAPSAYNPIEHPELAKQRRNTVLDVMAREGIITKAEASEYKEKDIELH